MVNSTVIIIVYDIEVGRAGKEVLIFFVVPGPVIFVAISRYKNCFTPTVVNRNMGLGILFNALYDPSIVFTIPIGSNGL